MATWMPEIGTHGFKKGLARAPARLRSFLQEGALGRFAESLAGLAPTLLAVAVVVRMFVQTHATFFSPAVPMNPKDEGYITAFAVRMLNGHFLPYVDAVSHRGPMLYVVAAIAVAIGGRESFVPIRTLGLLCSLLIVVLGYVAAARARRPLAGALAAIAIYVDCALELIPDDGLAYNGEPLLDVFALGALVCLVVGLAPERSTPSARWTATAGLLASLGALSKQVGAVTVVALAFWPFAAAAARPQGTTRARRWSPAWAYVAGAVAPLVLLILRYAASGQLRTLFFYTVTYNSHVYMAPLTGQEALRRYRDWMSDHAATTTIGVALVALGISRALSGVRRRGFWRCIDERGFLLTLAIGALVTGAASNATSRGFPHYFLQAVPWFALLGGVLLEEGLVSDVASPFSRTLVSAAALAPTLAIVAALHQPRLEDLRRAAHDHPRTLRICEFVDEHSARDDAMYVWGFAPDIYTYCHRRPASRFVYSTFQSGYVPFFDGATRDEDLRRIVPGGQEQFLGDLEEAKAALVIEVPWTMGNRKMDAIAKYASYLRTNFCPPVVYDRARVWVRKSSDRACPSLQ
jgi:hypothetical protein